MKIKRIKTAKCYPFNRFEDKKGSYKFKAEIYEDGGGWYETILKGQQLYCNESGNLDNWVENLEDKINELSLLKNFLSEVRYKYNQGINN